MFSEFRWILKIFKFFFYSKTILFWKILSIKLIPNLHWKLFRLLKLKKRKIGENIFFHWINVNTCTQSFTSGASVQVAIGGDQSYQIANAVFGSTLNASHKLWSRAKQISKGYILKETSKGRPRDVSTQKRLAHEYSRM